MSILVLGDANADLAAPLRAFPREGDDAALLDLAWGSGGAGVNVVTALALLGAKARLLACAGVDPAAEIALSAARRAGVDLSLVQRDASRATGLCFAAVSPGGERTFFSYRGANVALVEPDRDALFDGVDHLHLCGHALLEGAQRSATLGLIDEASRRALPLSLDLCLPLLRRDADLVLSLAPRLAILFGNEAELSLLAPLGGTDASADALDAALARLERAGVPRVVAKRGERGALIVERGQRESVPAFAIAAIDSTGAGDAHVAGILFALGRGASLASAARLGNALGALTTTRLGAAAALPARAELAAFLDARGAICERDLLHPFAPKHEPS